MKFLEIQWKLKFIDFHGIPLIFIVFHWICRKVHWFSLIFIEFHEFHCCSLIFIDVHLFSLIFIKFTWFFVDFHCRSLIFTDVHWFCSCFVCGVGLCMVSSMVLACLLMVLSMVLVCLFMVLSMALACLFMVLSMTLLGPGVRPIKNKSRNTGWTSVDRNARTTLSTFNTWSLHVWDMLFEPWSVSYGVRRNVSHMRCGIRHVGLWQRDMRCWILDTGYAVRDTS